MEKDKETLNPVKNAFVEANQEASDKNSTIGEAEIVKYDDVDPEHKAFEDIEEIQATDDV